MHQKELTVVDVRWMSGGIPVEWPRSRLDSRSFHPAIAANRCKRTGSEVWPLDIEGQRTVQASQFTRINQSSAKRTGSGTGNAPGSRIVFGRITNAVDRHSPCR